jgi:hypothetical protein
MPLSHRPTVSLTALLGLALMTAPQIAQAQVSTTTYRTSTAFTAINYEDITHATAFAYGDYQFGGPVLDTLAGTSYSFGDGVGTSLGAGSDTIDFYGRGWASALGLGFTDLKAGISATLENAYLDQRDPDNAPEYGNGMKAPAHWIARSSAGFTIDHRFNSPTVSGNNYTMKWVWSIDGATNSYDAGYGGAYLAFNHGANATQSFSTTSLTPQLWITDPVQVNWTNWAQTNVDFYAQWQYSMIGSSTPVYDNGLAGYVAPAQLNATVDYASTVKLQEIQIFDANGNRFYDFTIEDRAGSVIYNGNANAVSSDAPEPGTLSLLGAVFVGVPLLYRRRKRGE